MPGPTLDHVQIAAPPGCEPAARHFFGDLLGLEELPKPAPLSARGGCWFALGDRQLHIGVDPDFAPARKAHLALRVGPAELDDLAARLSSSGAPIAWDTALPTGRRFYSTDPWGNRIEFLAAAD
jgi:catechol 2,3-dioxygenase-like lactoylglutathione lyase family enzyme